jgi:protocatechuate 3,4-dioxygenase beta subunit
MESGFEAINRRVFLNQTALCMAASAVLPASAALGAQLQATPHQTEGPFYPDRMPPDIDNDLLIINDRTASATGVVTHLTGRVRDMRGDPVCNAMVEIWQCDNNGKYLHAGDHNPGTRDVNFQGFGRLMTGPTGEFYFRTIKPVPYPGRTPHIHLIVKLGTRRMLTTQLYIKGFPQNERDFLYQSLGAQQLVTADFAPLKGSTLGELAAHYEIVLGSAPEDPKQDRMRDLDYPRNSGRRG